MNKIARLILTAISNSTIISIRIDNKYVKKTVKEWAEYLNIPQAVIIKWYNERKEIQYISKAYNSYVFRNPIQVISPILMPEDWKKLIPSYKNFYEDLLTKPLDEVIDNIVNLLLTKYSADINHILRHPEKKLIINSEELNCEEISKQYGSTNTALSDPRIVALLYVLGSKISTSNKNPEYYVARLIPHANVNNRLKYFNYHGIKYSYEDLVKLINRNTNANTTSVALKSVVHTLKKKHNGDKQLISKAFVKYLDELFSNNGLSSHLNIFTINGKKMTIKEVSELTDIAVKTISQKIIQLRKQLIQDNPSLSIDKINEQVLQQLSQYYEDISNNKILKSKFRTFAITNPLTGMKQELTIPQITLLLQRNDTKLVRNTINEYMNQYGDKGKQRFEQLVEQELNNPGSTVLGRQILSIPEITVDGITKPIKDWIKTEPIPKYVGTVKTLERIHREAEQAGNNGAVVLENLIRRMLNYRVAFHLIPLKISNQYIFKSRTEWMGSYFYGYVTIPALRKLASTPDEEQKVLQDFIDKFNTQIFISGVSKTLKEWIDYLKIDANTTTYQLLPRSIQEISTKLQKYVNE